MGRWEGLKVEEVTRPWWLGAGRWGSAAGVWSKVEREETGEERQGGEEKIKKLFSFFPLAIFFPENQND